MTNINTKSYWNNRFASGDWEQKKGRNQTEQFAISQIPILNISKEFSGTILDFGCGLGDAFPIYKKAYPKAKLMGLDISEAAIKKCKEEYGHLAEFIVGDYTEIPSVDIIIASNVFEHLSEDKLIAKHLMTKCRELNIIVPYQERLFPDNEHINTYNKDSFNNVGQNQYKIFTSKAWGNHGIKFIIQLYFKNLLRLFLGRKLAKRQKQILFKISPVTVK